jgi:hypothetical protein
MPWPSCIKKRWQSFVRMLAVEGKKSTSKAKSTHGKNKKSKKEQSHKISRFSFEKTVNVFFS